MGETGSDGPLEFASSAALLRFTPDETARYFNTTMGLALSVDEVGALEARTEGWIAALQLAALSLQGRDDVADFIAGFAGSSYSVVRNLKICAGLLAIAFAFQKLLGLNLPLL